MTRIVVIGGLAAGPAAAARAAAVATAAEVTLIEAGAEIAYGICEFPLCLAGIIAEPDQLAPWDAASFGRHKRVRVLTGTRALAIDPAARQIHLRDERGRDREIPYDRLVLATGSTPVRPAAGAARCLKTLADIRYLRAAAAAAPGGHGAILGAGYVGLLAADALHRRGLRVTLFDRSELPLASFELETRRRVRAACDRAGVEFRPGVEVRTGTVEGADLVIAALGVRPEVGLARAAGIELGSSGAIATDERLETSAASVFAAGDCAEVRHLVSGAPTHVPLATVANRAGGVAGSNAAGSSARFQGSLGTLVFRAFGLELGRTGLNSEEAAARGFAVELTSLDTGLRVEAGGEQRLLINLVVDQATGRLLGADVCGPAGSAQRLNLLASQIQVGARVGEIAALDLGYAPELSPLVDPVLRAARRADGARRRRADHA